MSDIRTKYWKINNVSSDKAAIKEAGKILRQGGLVAFPTETVYGLGANALDAEAVGAIFKAKGRPQDNPLIVHIADFAEIHNVARLSSPLAERLINIFWPGPLTLVLPKTNAVPKEVTAGLDTVAVRMPDHPVAQAVITAAGVPIVAPSANLSGSPSPTTAQHVLEDLDGCIHGVLDGGPTNVGIESTVLDITGPTPTILRPGGVTAEQLSEVLKEVQYDPAIESDKKNITPRSPGVKYKHYSPKAPVILLEGTAEHIANHTKKLIDEYRQKNLNVGVLTSAENADQYCDSGAYVADYGSRNQPAAAAAVLYDLLRRFDHYGVDVIIAESLPTYGIGRAVMDRLRRAAGGNVLKV